MKKLLTLSLILAMMSMLVPIGIEADSQQQNYTFMVYQFTQSYIESKKDKIPNTKRIPIYPIPCTVSPSGGISVAGYTNDFSSYEIWDAEGEICLSVFTNEPDFINGLFSMIGEFQVRFISEDYVLIGYISTDI